MSGWGDPAFDDDAVWRPRKAHSRPNKGAAQNGRAVPGHSQHGQVLTGPAQGGQVSPEMGQQGQVLPGFAQGGQILPGPEQGGPVLTGFAQGGQVLPEMSQQGQVFPGPEQGGQVLTGFAQGGQVSPEMSQQGQVLPGFAQGGPPIPEGVAMGNMPGMEAFNMNDIPEVNIVIDGQPQGMKPGPTDPLMPFPSRVGGSQTEPPEWRAPQGKTPLEEALKQIGIDPHVPAGWYDDPEFGYSRKSTQKIEPIGYEQFLNYEEWSKGQPHQQKPRVWIPAQGPQGWGKSTGKKHGNDEADW